MNFLHPGAFFALASILLLILLSLWRQRAARVVVPSVRLWERIPDRLPPVRSLQRPRATISLLLQILIATILVFAMAGPGCTQMKPAPRRIAVVLDTSAYMEPRVDDVRRELGKLDPSDDLIFIETDSLTRRRGLVKFTVSSDRVADPRPALDLAASESKEILFISDRAPDWSPPPGATLHLALVGGPLNNTGIVDAGVEKGKLFLRLSAPAEVEVTVGTQTRRLPPALFHLVDVADDATSIGAKLASDAFAADDRVTLQREEGRIDVGFEGRPDAAILAAIESNPTARVVRGGSPRLLIRIGTAVDPTAAPVVIDVDPKEGVASRSEPREISVARHPLVEGVEAEDLKFTEVGLIAEPIGVPLIFSGGAPLAALRRPGAIVLAARYAASGWPARPSFPIFWSNVLRYSASATGTWRAKGLLDEAATSPGQERKPFDPGALAARPLAPRRSDLTGGFIAFAAALLVLLWWVESRPAAAG